MAVDHQGFLFECDLNMVRASEPKDFRCEDLRSWAETERTAITHAREQGWFVGTIRVTKGAPQSQVRSVRRVLCPACRWWVGL